MASTEKISVYSLADLKNTSDDAIPNYLNSLKFKQSQTLADIRLGIGYLALALCAATFCWDYKLGFDNTKYYTAAAVVAYTCLNGLLTLWIWGVEKGKVYVGTSPNGDKIEIVTSTQKHVPVYNVTITYYTSSRPTVPNTIKIARPFTEWFDAAGHFVPLSFQQMLAREVPMIEKADSSKAAPKMDGKAVQGVSGEGYQQVLDSIMVTGSTSGALADGAVPTPKKGASVKNRKKA